LSTNREQKRAKPPTSYLRSGAWSLAVAPEVRPAAEHSAYPIRDLGSSGSPKGERPEHIKVEVLRAPEGPILVCRCERCGAHKERLIDLRPTHAMSRDEKDAYLDRGPRQLFGTVPAAWVASHAGCASSPKVHKIEGGVRALAQQVIAVTQKALEGEGRIMPMLAVLTGPQRAVITHLPDSMQDALGSASEEWPSLRAQWHYALREAVRAEAPGLAEPVGALAVVEGWRYVNGIRTEVVGLLALTREAAFKAVLPVQRDSGVPEVGPGTIPGAPEWQPYVGEARILDGILAVGMLAP
jgi:hypothetical protein